MGSSKEIKSIYQKLLVIQQELKVKKVKGKHVFASRSAERILEEVKPILETLGVVLLMNEEVFTIGSRYYIKSTAKLIDCLNPDQLIESQTVAGEGIKSNMIDESQTTGKAISYARKYALGGLFAIDDTEDSDNSVPHKQEQKPQALSEKLKKMIANANSKEDLDKIYLANRTRENNSELTKLCSARTKVLSND